ncbi:Restriction endonuclease NaeI [Streptomyces sp. 2224.1]|nr:Restriction endonuclease NaeI [Streptomyces sp. 2224.1]
MEWFVAQTDLENRFSGVLRQSIDEVLDGQRTGRYKIDDLEKTEKTYLGTKVEIVCRAEFGFARGTKMDYQIEGVDVDAKFSLSAQWMIPREAMGHLCLLMTANEERADFKVGLVRICNEILNGGGNQDGKRGISSQGKKGIRWIFDSGALQENLLFKLTSETLEAVMSVPPGQSRVDQLFQVVQGRIIDRNAVLTTGKQLDAPKRVRDSRKRLAPKGVIILGHQNDSPRIAQDLGLPVPEKGKWVAVRVVPAPIGTSRPQVRIDGSSYVIAGPGDPCTPAPNIRY